MKVEAIKMYDIFEYDVEVMKDEQTSDPKFTEMEYRAIIKNGLSYEVNLGPIDPSDSELGEEIYNIPVTRKLEMFRLFPRGPLHRFNDPAVVMQWSQVNVCGDRITNVIQLWAWKGTLYLRVEEYYNALPNEQLSQILFNEKEHKKMLEHLIDDLQLATFTKGGMTNEAHI
jgi:hypothetical protein